MQRWVHGRKIRYEELDRKKGKNGGDGLKDMAERVKLGAPYWRSLIMLGTGILPCGEPRPDFD